MHSGHRTVALTAHLTKYIIYTKAVNGFVQLRASFATLSDDMVHFPSVLKLAISNSSGCPMSHVGSMGRAN